VGFDSAASPIIPRAMLWAEMISGRQVADHNGLVARSPQNNVGVFAQAVLPPPKKSLAASRLFFLHKFSCTPPDPQTLPAKILLKNACEIFHDKADFRFLDARSALLNGHGCPLKRFFGETIL